MGSEQIHFEALRKQMIIDRRNDLNIRKKFHNPPYQPHYLPYELPQDDMYFVYNDRVYHAKPTVHQFVPLSNKRTSQHPHGYLSMNDIHGNSSASARYPSNNNKREYSAKLPKRFNNLDYKSQW